MREESSAALTETGKLSSVPEMELGQAVTTLGTWVGGLKLARVCALLQRLILLCLEFPS